MEWLEALKRMKKQSGLTSQEISQRTGIPLPTLEKVFSGTTKSPKLNTMQTLVHFFGYTLDDLVNDCPEKEKSSSPDEPDDELTNEIAIALYKALIDAGWVRPGEDITEHQRKILSAIISILDTTFNEDGK